MADSNVLGTQTAAATTLISNVGSSHAALAAAEANLANGPTANWGVVGASDPLFTALTAQTVVGRLQGENPLLPSAILIDRTSGASGASIAQVAFTDRRQVTSFIAASNWLAAQSAPSLGQLELAATIRADMQALSAPGTTFYRETPGVEAIGRGTVATKETATLAGRAAIVGAGTLNAVVSQRVSAGTIAITGKGQVTSKV